MGLTSEVSAKALYTSGRTEIHDKLHKELTEKLTTRGIVLEDVLLKGIKLPKQLTDAIELKAQAEQESARMEFFLSKERQEADRKKVEAAGISAFQKIVSEGISSQLLQGRGLRPRNIWQTLRMPKSSLWATPRTACRCCFPHHQTTPKLQKQSLKRSLKLPELSI